MRILLILAHPDISSFNYSIAQAIRQALTKKGHDVIFHDLYSEAFDPILPAYEIPRDVPLDPVIARHCSELAQAEGIVVVHPNWWGQPPAILTGWIDRIIRPGVAYRFIKNDNGEGVPEGLLKARAALVINTSNTREERENLVFGDPLERIWRDCVFGLCGVTEFHRRILRIVVTSTVEQRQSWIQEMSNLAVDIFSNLQDHGGQDL
ncbi:NAD(P)H-dependent oxidoreductase [Methanospirillum lacunae]|uniref:NAD(P)H dehydrogenase n=1 Tax=Methanospirillum lacunae TaxID=668570 RepID=A0A2V2N7W0_9EURY|nr:NAD(P)H-dependent oxidoreductase [Methanospirillum lacunae]PWR71651.1 NAD(P)H dehydrogenase [Methanospirillum lacunae]